MSRELIVLLSDREVGRVRQDRRHRLKFVYDNEWREILIGAGGRVRLAPLYDLASVLAYDEFDPLKLRLSMKLGGKYRIRDIDARSWEKLAGDLRLDKKEIARRVCEMASKLPVEAQAIRKRLAESV